MYLVNNEIVKTLIKMSNYINWLVMFDSIKTHSTVKFWQKLLVLIIFCCFVVQANAQIKILNSDSLSINAHQETVIPYDSLNPIRVKSHWLDLPKSPLRYELQDAKYNGQKLYFAGEINLWDIKTQGNRVSTLKIDQIRIKAPGLYYTIKKVVDDEGSLIFKKNYPLDGYDYGRFNGLMLVSDDNTNMEYYFPSHRYSEGTISVGFYEKTKQLLIGKTFYIKPQLSRDDQYVLIDFTTGKEVDAYSPDKSFYTCKDITVAPSSAQTSFYFVVAIMTNDKGDVTVGIDSFEIMEDNKSLPGHIAGLLSTTSDRLGVEYFKTHKYLTINTLKAVRYDIIQINNYMTFKNYIDDVHNYIIKKYGQKYGQLIIDGQVCVGMTQEMCYKAWDNKELYNGGWGPRSNSSWEHNNGKIFFTNNKVSSIKLYDN